MTRISVRQMAAALACLAAVAMSAVALPKGDVYARMLRAERSVPPTHMEAFNQSVLAETGPRTLSYGYGTGVGAVTQPAKVYLIFWGSQWGARGTDAQGNATFSNDPEH